MSSIPTGLIDRDLVKSHASNLRYVNQLLQSAALVGRFSGHAILCFPHRLCGFRAWLGRSYQIGRIRWGYLGWRDPGSLPEAGPIPLGWPLCLRYSRSNTKTGAGPRTGVPRNWGEEDGSDMTAGLSPAGGSWMGWVLRLVETGTDNPARDVDVMKIARPGTLADIANLGLRCPRGSCFWRACSKS